MIVRTEKKATERIGSIVNMTVVEKENFGKPPH